MILRTVFGAVWTGSGIDKINPVLDRGVAALESSGYSRPTLESVRHLRLRGRSVQQRRKRSGTRIKNGRPIQVREELTSEESVPGSRTS
jgi:hypothetical protein